MEYNRFHAWRSRLPSSCCGRVTSAAASSSAGSSG
jgi:hypothetical protein